MADDQLPEGTDTIIDGAAGSSSGDSARWSSTRAGIGDNGDFSGTKPSGDGAAAGGDKGAWLGRIEDLKTQSYDSARAYAVTGKDKATGALDELIRTVSDAADQIDAKVGVQYGDYARKAIEGIGTFNEGLKGKDVDELFAEARALVARAPAVAVGTAAALGFVIARLARSGLAESATAKTSSDN